MIVTIYPQKGEPYKLNTTKDDATLMSVVPVLKGRKEVQFRTRTLVPRRVTGGDLARLDYPIDQKHADGIVLNIFAHTLILEIGGTVNDA